MKRKITTSIVSLLLFVYIGSSTYAISTQGIEDLLLCADRGGLKVPFSKQLCRRYLLNFRGSKEDIDILQQGIGAMFLTQGESTTSERTELLKFLIDKGLDVNRAGMDRLLPLHGAVLANSADEIMMLLDNGANQALKDNRFELTPLELALKLQSEDKTQIDRSAVIAILRNTDSAAQRSGSPAMCDETARRR